MTTFTTEDRLAAQKEAEMEILGKLMHQQYDQVKDIIAHVKPKPLTDEEITGIRMKTEGDMIAFARAIEEAHGIKWKQNIGYYLSWQ
mgnify:CR=1 FL=1